MGEFSIFHWIVLAALGFVGFAGFAVVRLLWKAGSRMSRPSQR
jgi:hypothetical protein